MHKVEIHKEHLPEVTVLSNIFIDHYMVQAGGEFVKVYLMLLRLSGDPGQELTVAQIADRMNCTEADILRALRYWEKKMDGSDNYDLATTDTLTHTSGLYSYTGNKDREEA